MSLSGDWAGHCQVREFTLVHDECVMETVLMAPIDQAERMQRRLDAYIEPIVHKTYVEGGDLTSYRKNHER